MILGNVKDVTQMDALKLINKDFGDAIQFMMSGDFSNLELGRIEIENTNIFGIFQKYVTHPLEGGIWEAHRKYLDIQFLIEGKENIAVAPIDKMQVTSEYSRQSDVVLGNINSTVSLFEMHPGDFMILFPEEAHMPGIDLNEENQNIKMVIKIPVPFSV